MKEKRTQAYDNIFNLYINRLNQVEALQFINRFFGGGAIVLAFMTDKPALWIGLGIATVDAIYNEIRLRREHSSTIDQYHTAKNSVAEALNAEKDR